MNIGSIHVLLSDTLELPKDINWNNTIVIVKENEIFNIENILKTIPFQREQIMRQNCINAYNKLRNNFCNN